MQRLYEEDIMPALNFDNALLAEAVLRACQQNTLAIEPQPVASNSSVRYGTLLMFRVEMNASAMAVQRLRAEQGATPLYLPNAHRCERRLATNRNSCAQSCKYLPCRNRSLLLTRHNV